MDERKLEPIIESYNVDEEYLYKDVYQYIKGVADALKLRYTAKALPLARRIHSGQYRKGQATINGQKVRLPYFLHCLKVCSTLIGFEFYLTDEEKDILYAAALLHDVVEERPDLFPRGGEELHDEYEFPARLVTIIKLLSKQSGADEYELNAYFNALKKDKLALLVKLADRSHNVEDLYNMKNVKKYIEETRRYFLDAGICRYGKDHYPELSNGITQIKSKILSLIEEADYFIDEHDKDVNEFCEALLKKDTEIAAKDEEIARLKKEIDELKKELESKKGNA